MADAPRDPNDGLSDPQVRGVRPEDTQPGDNVTVVNESGLPDGPVLEAVKDHFIEEASMAWGRTTHFQSYAGGHGSMLARREYRSPTNVIDEIRLARDLAERDDDVAAAIGSMIGIAFADGMANFHEDEKTVGLFNAIARNAKFDHQIKEMYREYLISSQINSVSLFTREMLEWQPVKGNQREESVAAPLVGVLPAENIRILGDDIFGTGVLAYDPDDQHLRDWLNVFFSENTSPAKKAEMGRLNRVAANMFTGIVNPSDHSYEECVPYHGDHLYYLNPRMVHRSTMPKGSWKYPRPLLTRNFALLEAKRLLNIMDFALLQGGANFIIVVKKGTDQLPAKPQEVTNLTNVVRAASRTGIIVGDHRLSIEVITPDLKELLNPQKRRLVGRKLASALLRVPEAGVEEPGVEGMRTEVEIISRVIASDRQDIKRHVEGHIYNETVRRNKRLFTKGHPKLWFPKIILQGTQYFNDLVLKLRDRGDIPRKWAVEAGGFDYEAAVQQRQRELDAGDDEVMAPAAVPFSSPDMGPQDNQDGRPPGGKDDRPQKRIIRTPGETVKAYYDETAETVVRVGDCTEALLESYPDCTVGRIQTIERDALDGEATIVRGSVMAVAVNPGVKVREEKAVRLREGLSVITGQRLTDDALIAKVIVLREPDFSPEEAETAVARWGFGVHDLQGEERPKPEADENGMVPPQVVVINQDGESAALKTVIDRDGDGNIVGSHTEPIEAD